MPSFSAARLMPLALACCVALAVVSVGWLYLDRDGQPTCFARQNPPVGGAAPDFTLRDADSVPFHLAAAGRPVVLEFGSATCVECVLGHFEQKEQLAREFGDRAAFLFVYCQEANPGHAVGSMAMQSGPAPGLTLTWQERARRARNFSKAMNVGRRVLIDGDGDDCVQALYGGRDNECVVVGADGRVAFKRAQTDPRELRHFLEGHLGEPRTK
jgi:hypothetical protein